MKSFRIDYISFSIPDYARQRYLDFLGADLVWLDRGFRGYKEGAMLSKGGMFGMTIGRDDSHFDLPGKAFAQYIGDFGRFCELVKMIISDGGNISRVDYAVDVEGEFPFSTVLRAVRGGCLVSKSRVVQVVEKFENTGDGQKNLGGTIYVGSRKSHKMLRVYDKAAEQGVDGDLVRWELLLRDEAAMSSVRELLGMCEFDAVRYIFGLIYGFVDFRKNDNRNISRRSQLRWYAKFMSGVDAVKLVFDRVEKTITGLVDWVERQVAPSLALMKRYFGDGFISVFDYLVYIGDSRLRAKHFELLQT